jgi:hypothetical protein
MSSCNHPLSSVICANEVGPCRLSIQVTLPFERATSLTRATQSSLTHTGTQCRYQNQHTKETAEKVVNWVGTTKQISAVV